MKICFLSTGPFAHTGAYIDHFKAAGHDVSFVSLSPGPDRGVPTRDVSLGGAYDGVRGKWKYPLSMLLARRAVRELNPDVVHAHYATSGGLAGLVCGVRPTVVTAHGTDLVEGARSPVWRPLLRRVLACADLVNPVSEGLRALAAGLGVPDERMLVLTPGVDVARFRPRAPRPPVPGRELRLVSTRRMEAVYDPLTVVRALAQLRRRGVRFRMTFAGDGSLRAEAERLAASLGLDGVARFVGAVSAGDMPELLGSHDAYLSASLSDGASLSLLEAMAAGLFPVVSDIPANRDWLVHGVSGLLHAPGDAGSLAAALERFAAAPTQALAAAERNLEAVRARGDRPGNMRRLEAAYRDLAGGRRGFCIPPIGFETAGPL